MQISGSNKETAAQTTQAAAVLSTLTDAINVLTATVTSRPNETVPDLPAPPAAVIVSPTDFPDTAATEKLTEIQATLQSSVGKPDTVTHGRLQGVIDALHDVSAQIAALPAYSLTDEQLRAEPVDVQMPLPADYPDTGTHDLIADLRSDVMDVENAVTALPQVQPLTAAQLRSEPVAVSGVDFPADFPDTGTQALLDAVLVAVRSLAGAVAALPQTHPEDFPAVGTQQRLDLLRAGQLTDEQLRAAPLSVSGPLTNGQLRDAAVAVVGPLTSAELRTTPVNVAGPLTDAQLRASALAVTGFPAAPTDYPAADTKAGLAALHADIAALTAAVNRLPVNQAATDTQLRAAPVPVSGPVTDTQLRAAAIPVAGPLTDVQLRANAVPVSGPLTDAQIRATALAVSGPLTDAQLRAAALTVNGSVISVALQATQAAIDNVGLAANTAKTLVTAAQTANLRKVVIRNTGSLASPILIALGSTASAANHTYALAAGATVEISDFAGMISAFSTLALTSGLMVTRIYI